MSNKPELVVMLTHHDLTVENAAEIFEQCKQSKARCWGFKEHPLPFEQMRELFSYCQEHDIRHMPFVGRVEGRPSVLSGSIDEIVAEAQDYVRKGVYGIDLLGYRYRATYSG